MLSDRNIGGNSHLPATDTQQEANHVGLLLLLDLFHVLEGTHLDENRNISLSCSIFFFSMAAERFVVSQQESQRKGAIKRTLSAWQVVDCRRLSQLKSWRSKDSSLFNDLVCGTLEN